MAKFLSMTNEQREAIGKAGREKMEKEFEKMAVVKETISGLRM